MENFLLIYYTESKYLHHLRKSEEFFNYKEDLIDFLNNKLLDISDFTIYKRVSDIEFFSEEKNLVNCDKK